MNFISNQKPTSLISWRSLLAVVFLCVGLVPPGVAVTADAESDCHSEMAMDGSMAGHHMDHMTPEMDSGNSSHCQGDCANQGSNSCIDGSDAGCAFTGNASSALFLAPSIVLDLKNRSVAISTSVPLALTSKHPGPELRPPISH